MFFVSRAEMMDPFLAVVKTLLYSNHVESQGWLVTHSIWNTTQQSRHLE